MKLRMHRLNIIIFMIFLCALDLYPQENVQTAKDDVLPVEEKSEVKKNIIPEYEVKNGKLIVKTKLEEF